MISSNFNGNLFCGFFIIFIVNGFLLHAVISSTDNSVDELSQFNSNQHGSFTSNKEKLLFSNIEINQKRISPSTSTFTSNLHQREIEKSQGSLSARESEEMKTTTIINNEKVRKTTTWSPNHLRQRYILYLDEEVCGQYNNKMTASFTSLSSSSSEKKATEDFAFLHSQGDNHLNNFQFDSTTNLDKSRRQKTTFYFTKLFSTSLSPSSLSISSQNNSDNEIEFLHEERLKDSSIEIEQELLNQCFDYAEKILNEEGCSSVIRMENVYMISAHCQNVQDENLFENKVKEIQYNADYEIVVKESDSSKQDESQETEQERSSEKETLQIPFRRKVISLRKKIFDGFEKDSVVSTPERKYNIHVVNTDNLSNQQNEKIFPDMYYATTIADDDKNDNELEEILTSSYKEASSIDNSANPNNNMDNMNGNYQNEVKKEETSNKNSHDHFSFDDHSVLANIHKGDSINNNPNTKGTHIRSFHKTMPTYPQEILPQKKKGLRGNNYKDYDSVISPKKSPTTINPSTSFDFFAVPSSSNTQPSYIPYSWGLDRIDSSSMSSSSVNNNLYYSPQSIYKINNNNPIDLKPFEASNLFPTKGRGVDIYIVDTGCRTSHQEFLHRNVYSIPAPHSSYVNGNDGHGHGTLVASIAAGNYLGVAKNSRLTCVKALNDQNWGYTVDVISSINYIIGQAKMKAKQTASYSTGGIMTGVYPTIISVSISAPKDNAFNNAVRYATDNGILVVVASGNDGQDASQFSPASATSGLTVGSSNKKDEMSSFSNYGESVDIIAPGEDVVGAWASGDSSYYKWSGTSFAAPLVTGSLALYLSQEIHTGPYFAPRKIKYLLASGAKAKACSQKFLEEELSIFKDTKGMVGVTDMNSYQRTIPLLNIYGSQSDNSIANECLY